MEGQEITTTRLPLRPLTLNAAADIYTMRAYENVYKWLSDSPIHFSNSPILSAISETGTPSDETLRIIGVSGLDRFDELFTMFHSSFHGRGYATEALNTWLDVLWEEYPERDSVHGGFFEGNEASRKVLEKVGFVFEKWTMEV
ncbi:hypothetical protein LTS18_003367 [Coniosporium uncinatum]|uniref:Uncharacterized protein n=1 Tax=Coniosporium uncinatum TaxID=93489 RepID=A0ACC3D772_9PEZI|nr:hypothetical protein LTS18_003367 [Coniosporium uncinatum]